MDFILGCEEDLSYEKVITLLKKYTIRPDNSHEEKVRTMALILFDALSTRFSLTKEHRILLEYSALLHDIGLFVNKKKHNLHSQYLILKDNILDSTSYDFKQSLAILVGNHRKSIDKNIYLLPTEDQVLLLRLLALLRIADGLDHTHKFKTSIEKIEVTENKIILFVKGTDLDCIWKKLQCKSALFVQVFHLEISYIKDGCLEFM